MAIIIMNDNKYYITHNENGGLKKTKDITEAEDFEILEKAIGLCKHCSRKTRGYYIYDTVSNKICYRKNFCKPNKKMKRKKYSKDARQLIYERAD